MDLRFYLHDLPQALKLGQVEEEVVEEGEEEVQPLRKRRLEEVEAEADLQSGSDLGVGAVRQS